MWAIMGVLATGMLVTALEAPYLWRKRLYKELILFGLLLLAGVLLGVLQSLGVPIPNPLDAITLLYKPASDWLVAILK